MTVERDVKQQTPTAAAASDPAREVHAIETPDVGTSESASIADLTPADVHAWLAALAAGRTARPAPAAPSKPVARRSRG
jgi:hypothetical protein